MKAFHQLSIRNATCEKNLAARKPPPGSASATPMTTQLIRLVAT